MASSFGYWVFTHFWFGVIVSPDGSAGCGDGVKDVASCLTNGATDVVGNGVGSNKGIK